MVIPGSHKGPVFDHHHNGIFAGGVNTDAIGDLADKAVALTAPAGSLTIHHVRTLHASGNSSTNTLRPLLLFSYTAVDAFPIFSSYDLQEYDSRILRGAPVQEGRMAALPFRIHLPQEPGTDSIYDNQESMQR
jgi:ectoine hydroxylase-related dioxygenase (phytanoyl-CoA dioxygenase family)